MFEWIQNAIKGVKFNRKGATTGKKEKKQDKNRGKDKKSSLTPSTTDELKFSSAPETSILHCETRNRPRGPTGRRPPVRKNFNPSTDNRLSSTEMDSSDDHGLSYSITTTANGKMSKEIDSKILLDQSTLFNNDTSSSPVSGQPTTPNQQINDFPKASFVSNHKLQCNRKSGSRLPQAQDASAANTINTSNIHCDVNDNDSNVSPDHNGYPPPSSYNKTPKLVSHVGDAIESLWSSKRERLSSLFSWVTTVPGADVCKHSAQMKKDLKKVDDSLIKLSQQLNKLKASMTKTSTSTDSEPGHNNVQNNDQNHHHHILLIDDICQQANDIRTFPIKHLSDSLDLVDDNFKLIIDSISEYISSKPPSPELVT